MQDAGDLAAIEHAPRVQVEHHRRRRLLLVAHEHALLGDGDMHARRLDRADSLDGARQFTFDGALVVDLLGKLADAELLVVHQFEADATGLGEPLRRQLQTDIVDFVGRHRDHAAATDLIGHVHLLQGSRDLAAIAVGQIGEQDFVVGRTVEDEQADNDREYGSQRRKQEDFLVVGQRLEAVARFIDARAPGGCSVICQISHTVVLCFQFKPLPA